MDERKIVGLGNMGGGLAAVRNPFGPRAGIARERWEGRAGDFFGEAR